MYVLRLANSCQWLQVNFGDPCLTGVNLYAREFTLTYKFVDGLGADAHNGCDIGGGEQAHNCPFAVLFLSRKFLRAHDTTPLPAIFSRLGGLEALSRNFNPGTGPRRMLRM